MTEIGDEGEHYSYPLALNSPGFFEDFFDGKERQFLSSGGLLINGLRLLASNYKSIDVKRETAGVRRYSINYYLLFTFYFSLIFPLILKTDFSILQTNKS